MIGKFALMMCPVPQCPKMGADRCPIHDKPMERTVVMTERYARDTGKFSGTIESTLRGLDGLFGKRS